MSANNAISAAAIMSGLKDSIRNIVFLVLLAMRLLLSSDLFQIGSLVRRVSLLNISNLNISSHIIQQWSSFDGQILSFIS